MVKNPPKNVLNLSIYTNIIDKESFKSLKSRKQRPFGEHRGRSASKTQQGRRRRSGTSARPPCSASRPCSATLLGEQPLCSASTALQCRVLRFACFVRRAFFVVRPGHFVHHFGHLLHLVWPLLSPSFDHQLVTMASTIDIFVSAQNRS